MSMVSKASVMAVLAFMTMALLAATPVIGKEDQPNGIGWLTDYCDDDWDMKDPFWYVGKCDNATNNHERNIMRMDISLCYTVTDDGRLSVDNWHQGGMREKCKDCTRTIHDGFNAPIMCKCQMSNGKYVWAEVDLDDTLYLSYAWANICCGEWWGGPTCGLEGPPDLLSGRGLDGGTSHDD